MPIATKQDWEPLLNLALVKLPGASTAGLKAELYNVLHEFFNFTSWWQEGISVNILANERNYDLVPTPPGQIIRLVSVVDPIFISWAGMMPHVGTLTLRDLPSNPFMATVTVTKQVTPAKGRSGIPEIHQDVIELWGPVILDGLLGQMMNQPAKSYTSPAGSKYHLARFQSGMGAARTARLRSNTYGTNAWRFPRQFRTAGQRGGVSVGNEWNF